MKNIQVIDGAENATYSIFQVSEEEFSSIFPMTGQDLEVVEDFIERVGEREATRILTALWERPIYKHEVRGIHGTLFYDYEAKRSNLPASRREIDRASGQINEAERVLYGRLRDQ